MDTQKTFAELRQIERKLHAYTHAQGVVYLDSVTAAPPDADEGISETLGVLSEMEYEYTAGEHTKQIIEELKACSDELDETEKRELEEFSRENDFWSKVPKEEYVEYQKLVSTAENVWHKAKSASDYGMFEPYLKKIIAANKRFAKLYAQDRDPYDVLLDRYERGLDTKKADAFFTALKTGLKPLLEKVVNAQQIPDAFMHASYPVYKQRELTALLMRIMCLDPAHCTVSETEHPFTIEFNNKDVRITTHYYENAFASSMFSVIHESGHALYELNSADQYEYTCLAGGISMGIHESQSRFYENILGRSREFTGFLLPELKKIFPAELSGVSENDFYRAVNKAEPSLIRTEADELTYPFHILIRYELEKALMDGSLSTEELPAAWNAKYTQYLGVDVLNDKTGVLQDSHWSGGSIGYFPSYALGSAYGAQMFANMKGDLDVKALLAAGELKPIIEWLSERIYRHGKRYDPEKLILLSCGAPFDPKYYIDYLTDKYSEIYSLDR